jgi:DinB superfamily
MPVVAGSRAEARWHAVVEEHQVALAAYLDAAARLPEGAWDRPWAPGKWSPAQLTEHLSLTYRVLTAELQGGEGMRLKLTPLRRRVLKTLMLPHMLFHRTFPRRAPAPREVRPGEGPYPPRAEALARMRALGEAIEREAERARAAGIKGVSHAYFGTIDLTRGMRLCAVHLEHHTRQLASIKG